MTVTDTRHDEIPTYVDDASEAERSVPRWVAIAGGAALVAGGALLVRRAKKADSENDHSPSASVGHEEGVRVEKTVMVNKPADELYRFWRNFENLPRFMDHLEAVQVHDDTHSHWKVKGPVGKSVEWDAVIINDIPNELIAWKSTSADIANAGSVRFRHAPGDGGTEVTVNLEYDPPAGKVGALLAKLTGEEPTQQVQDDLQRFKQVMESGDLPAIKGAETAVI